MHKSHSPKAPAIAKPRGERALRLLDGVDANIWEADPRTLQRRFVTKFAEELLGYPIDRWLHEPAFWRSIVHSEDRARALEETFAAIKSTDRYTLKYRMAAADGRIIWVRDSVRVARDGTGEPTSLFGVMTDITDLERALDSLRRSEERFRTVVESAKDYAIFTVDLDGTITGWNSGARNITGWSEAEVVGKSGRILFTPEDNEHSDAEHEIDRALVSGRSVNERWHMHKSGRRFWGSGLMMPMRDDSGRAFGLVKIVRDATEQMRMLERIRTFNAELEMRVSERTAQLESANRELESFSYTISHDLQAPLRKLDGYSRVILQDYGDKLDDAGRDRLGRIRAAAGQMARMIDDLLNLARVVRGKMKQETIDLSALVAEIVAELQSGEPRRKASFKIAPGLRDSGDPELLRVAMFNLLDNAWKFSSRKPETRIEFGSLTGGDQAVYFVRDHGAGFDMAYGSKLFHEFSRLHDKAEFPGTGIGLATVARIIRRHGGRIWAEGAPGSGATFYFTLRGETRPRM